MKRSRRRRKRCVLSSVEGSGTEKLLQSDEARN